MQKIINDPSWVVDDMLQGFVNAHPDLIATTENEHVLKYVNAPVEGKVGVVTGGGSGHKPAFIGYIGKNMVDAVAVGELFSSPPAPNTKAPMPSFPRRWKRKIRITRTKARIIRKKSPPSPKLSSPIL
jgi:dihydroxyacetone kinase